MQVGIQCLFSAFGYDNMSDTDVVHAETKLMILADELGFDAGWAAEHHYFDYAFCPDNLQFLAYIAGRTSHMNVGTAAIILPYHNPLQVAERIALFDAMTDGRLLVGFGRGAARREYEPLHGIDLSESRERFDEASVMIVDALETGVMKGDGPFYPQELTDIRPRPSRSFTGRILAVAGSPESVDAAARIGGQMLMFAEVDWEKRRQSVERYAELFRDQHTADVPPVHTHDLTYIHHDPAVAKERGERYLSTYLQSVLHHYELLGDHFATTKGYERYAANAKEMKAKGFEKHREGFLRANAFGTPDQMLERLWARRDEIGHFDLTCGFRFGGIPDDEAEASMRLFADEVMPVVRSWS